MANIVLPFVTTYDDKGAKKAQTSLAGLAKSSLVAGVSIGAVTQQLGKAVRAAADDAKQQDLLRNAIENNTNATADQIAGVEDAISKMQFQAAVSDEELRPAFANLVRATGDVTKAQGLLSLALDLSAGTGRSLESTSIALSKSQMGQFTALTRLGIPLDKAALKSKDLAAIQADLAERFKGASQAAADSSAGGMRKLSIILDETYETVGKQLIPIMEDYAEVLGTLAQKTLTAEADSRGFGNTLKNSFKAAFPQISGINKAIGKLADNFRQANIEANRNNQVTSRVTRMTKEYTDAVENNTEKQNRNNEAKRKAKERAKDYADTLRSRVQRAVDATADALTKAQDEFDNYSKSLSDAITSSVSLADAYKTQKDSEADLTDALRERTQAYAALNRLNPIDDAERYADALQDVADAENKVRSATSKRGASNIEAVFASQIANAKEFANNLQTLIGQGLQQAGLAQLINLGVDAGNEVTRAMIAGTSGLSVSGINQSMQEITQTAGRFGEAGANAFFGGALGLANANAGTVNQYSITVHAGLVSNPAQVGRDIIESIKQAERVSGIVFGPP